MFHARKGSILRSTTHAVLLILAGLAPASPAVSTDESEPFISGSTSDFVDWCDQTKCVSPAMALYYNRVDGILFFLGAKYRNDTRLHPRLRAVRGWTSAREERNYYQIDFEQPFHTQDSFSIGVSFYGETGWSREDDEAVSDVDNDLRAFIERRDYRDYFRREGITIFLRLHATPELTLRLEHRNDELTSLSTRQSVWSVLRHGEDWRENPPLMVGIQDAAQEFEGRMKSYFGSVVYDSRDEYTRTGWLARGFFEFAGGSLGGDYDFRKYVLDVRRYLRFSETQTLTLQASWGIGAGTRYPSHKLFYLGGIENLRGYDRKVFSGKNMMFGRAEYGVQMTPKLEVIYFFDTGAAWDTGGNISGDFHHDFGIGFRFDAPWVGDLRLDIARAATTQDADIFVDLRLCY